MSKNTGTSELINYFDLGVNGDVGIAGSLDINTIANATTDTDTFLVSDSGVIKYRTGAQLLSDIGAQAAGNYVTTDTSQAITANKSFTVGFSLASEGSGNQTSFFRNTSSIFSGSGGSNIFGFNNSNNIYFGKGLNNGGVLQWNNTTATRYYTLPDADGTIALTSQIPSNPIGGTGTTNQIPKFSGTSTLTNSNILDNGTEVNIQSRVFVTSGGQQFVFTPNLATTSNRIETTGSLPLEIVSGGNIRFAAGGATPQITLTSTGNVGIGTSTPSERLEVNGSIRLADGNADGPQLKLASSGFSDWNIDNFSGSLRAYYGSTEYLRLTSVGNLLVGTTTDNGARLQVSGTATFSGIVTGNANEAFRLDPSSGASYMNFRIGGTSYSLIGIAGTTSDIIAGSALGDLNIRATNNQKILFSTNNGGSAALTIASTGAATFSSTLRATEITASMPSGNGALYINNSSLTNKNWTFIPQTSSGETDLLLFYTGAAAGTRLTVTNSGNVGIGTTSPGAILTVVGQTGVLNGNYRYNAAILQDQATGRGVGFGFKSDEQLGLIYGETAAAPSNLAFMTYSGSAFLERMRITSGGNTVLGGNAGSGWSTAGGRTTLEIYGSIYPTALHNSSSVGNSLSYNTYWDGANWRFVQGGTSVIYIQDSEGHKFLHNSSGTAGASFTPTERMRITSSGNVGIGSTSPFARLQVTDSNTNEGTIAIGNNIYPGLIFSSAGTGEFRIDNRSSAGGGYISFYPNGQASTLGNEAMRVSTSRNLLIGTTTDTGARLNVGGSYDGYPVSIEAGSGGNQLSLTRGGAVAQFYMGGSTAGGTQFYVRAGGSGGVLLSAGSTGWVSASDIRLKDVTKPIENAVESLSSLQTIYYSWKDSINKNLHIGLIAQEVEKVFPELVSESSIDGMKGVNYTELIPVIIKAIQELNEKINR